MQNDMRNRLVELYKEATTLYFDYLDSIDEKGLTDTEGRAKFTIDHLIANGVIVPPCKVGDKVYAFSYPRTDIIVIDEETVEDLHLEIETDGGWYGYGDIGETVFLTKEQAEQKLKELSENADKR